MNVVAEIAVIFPIRLVILALLEQLGDAEVHRDHPVAAQTLARVRPKLLFETKSFRDKVAALSRRQHPRRTAQLSDSREL